MKNTFRLLLLLGIIFSANAQQKPVFQKLRYDDDFQYLKADSTKTWYKKIKYIPLGKNDKYYASIGGEIREQYFYTVNDKWGDETTGGDGYLLSRYLLNADVHLGKFRTFIEFQSSLANSKIDPSPVDENELDFHQAFLDVDFIQNKNQQLTFRVGRQEIAYGSQRLVSVRERPNNRIAFDGMKLFYKNNNWQTDAFYSHPVANKPGVFNDDFNDNAKLWGSYFVIHKVPFIQNIDLYYLGLWKNRAVFDNAIGEETRHSIGTRIWKTKGNWKYDFEGLYQFGKIESQNISAWTLSSNTSYTFENVKFNPEIGLKTEFISGDKNSNDNQLQTFNPLYPKGAYFGLVGLIGPSNLIDIHPSIALDLTEKLGFGIDYDIFWRSSIHDGLYAPNMQLLYSGDNTTERFIGTQLITNFDYNVNPFLTVSIEGAWFDAGAFLKEAGSGKDYFYTALTAQFKF
ncbi:Alginate export [Flavobacterium sp. CF108]|uniref:alginate export family protein n=1 Tax=unclassified Flavobacterium TaxID=196869 RepID=UPI0008C157A7|nr:MULTISPECIES: alginate export family protein [unclassified Flavobacterium]SEP08789.1 Alginate export [Flavobacterium sp. fv08]SHH96076.1 Alginate export [Flavobacterium sp. CF108]